MEIHYILKMAINVCCLQDKGERVAALNEALDLYMQLFSDFYKLPVDKRNEMKLRIIHVASEFAIKGEQ